jgi:hypothetical protein
MMQKMIKYLGQVLNIIAIYGYIIGLIWLIILFEWQPIVIGLIMAMFGHYVISLLMFLSFFIVMPLLFIADKVKSVFVQLLSGFFIGVVNAGIMVFWCYITLYLMLGDQYKDLLPYLLWANGVALGPFVYLAKKDQPSIEENETQYAWVSLFFCQLGFVLNIILIGFFSFKVEETIIVFSLIMLMNVFLQTAHAFKSRSHF